MLVHKNTTGICFTYVKQTHVVDTENMEQRSVAVNYYDHSKAETILKIRGEEREETEMKDKKMAENRKEEKKRIPKYPHFNYIINVPVALSVAMILWHFHKLTD